MGRERQTACLWHTDRLVQGVAPDPRLRVGLLRPPSRIGSKADTVFESSALAPQELGKDAIGLAQLIYLLPDRLPFGFGQRFPHTRWTWILSIALKQRLDLANGEAGGLGKFDEPQQQQSALIERSSARNPPLRFDEADPFIVPDCRCRYVQTLCDGTNSHDPHRSLFVVRRR